MSYNEVCIQGRECPGEWRELSKPEEHNMGRRTNFTTQPVLYKGEERRADVSVSIDGDDTVTTLTFDGEVIYQARFSGAAIHPDKSPEQLLDNLVRDYRTFASISYELGNYIEFTDDGEARAPATTEKTSF